MTTVVYTDGACSGNPGPGGWAWAVPDGEYASGAHAQTTNQRMELVAVLEAVQSLDGPVRVVSDSTYVVNCFRDRWWEGWVARGWTNKARKPVANRDLWEPLINLYRADPQRLEFTWVKGHGGDAMNDLVDRLAVEAAATQTGRRGHGRPTDLGPPDAPRRGAAAGARAGSGAAPAEDLLPVARRVAVAGHRPPELGGYDANPTAERVRDKLVEILRAKHVLHPDLVVLTGLGLGAEQLGADAAIAAGVPFVAVLPYPAQEKPWPKQAQERYADLLAAASREIVLDSRQPETKQKAGAALSRRDAFLARHANEAVIVWDGDDDRVGRLVRSFTDHLGEEEVWVVAP